MSRPPVTPEDFTLTTYKAAPCIETRQPAVQLGKKHQSLFELVKDHRADFAELGLVRFQTGEPTGGRPERFALLNEDQSYLLLTYTRNTERTRQRKVRLVKAFGEARRAAWQRQAEYLPTYHQLHDELHTLAAGSANGQRIHMNVNKLINQVVGLKAGQRAAAPLPKQSMLAVAQSVAASAARGAPSYQAGYERIKSAMLALSAINPDGLACMNACSAPATRTTRFG